MKQDSMSEQNLGSDAMNHGFLSKKWLQPFISVRSALSNKEFLGRKMACIKAPRRQRAQWAALPLLVLAGLLGTTAQAEQVDCTPSPGFASCKRITYSGADQTFAVPAGVNFLHVRVWGAGGGGPGSGAASGGGGGGFAAGTVSVPTPTTLTSLTIRVGQGGVTASTDAPYGGGGRGGPPGANPNPGGSGGGYSGIFSGTTPIIIAGGGGGGAPGADTSNPTAGGGGGTVGNSSSNTAYGGSGGTQAAGGIAATTTGGCTTAANVGTSLRGGNGAAGTGKSGGGGGGGYFGGGGGRCQAVTAGAAANGPGGGGSSYIAHNRLLTASTPAPITVAGSNGQFDSVGGDAAQAVDGQYSSGIGKGAGAGGAGTAAGNGEVVIQWVVPPRVKITKTTATGITGTHAFPFTHTGLKTFAGVAADSSTLSVTGVGSVSSVSYVGIIGADQTITETPPAGFRTKSIQCLDANAATNENTNPVASSTTAGVSTITIPAAAMKGRDTGATSADITCTFINEEEFPTLTKAFVPAAIGTGVVSTLTITLSNTAPTVATLTAPLTDLLPAGVVVASPRVAGSNCSGSAALVAVINTSVVTLPTGRGIPASGSCTITVNVTSPTLGTYPNIIDAGALKTSNGNNPEAATATLTVTTQTADLRITKSDGLTSIPQGGLATYTIVVTNPGPSAADGAVFKDPAVLRLTVNDLSCEASDGAVCPADLSITEMQGAGLVIPTLPSLGSVTFKVTGIAGVGGTTITNVASVTPPNDIYDPTPANNSASDSTTISNISGGQSAVRRLSDNAFANGSDSNQLQALVRIGGAGAGAGIVVTWAGRPNISLNGGPVGQPATCITDADSYCVVFASTLIAGVYGGFTAAVVGEALTGAFVLDGGVWSPSVNAVTFTDRAAPAIGTCNANPVLSPGNFQNSNWTATGWNDVSPNTVMFSDNTASGVLSQTIYGVSPGALLTFTWGYGNANRGANTGHAVALTASYDGVVYWRGSSSVWDFVNSPTSVAENGATCLAGCEGMPQATTRDVTIRLPMNVPMSGLLRFTATASRANSDDPGISGPITLANTGVCLVKTSQNGIGTFNFVTSGLNTTLGGTGVAATQAAITTTTPATATYYDPSAAQVQNQAMLVLNPGPSANVTITENPTAGFTLEDMQCTAVRATRDGDVATTVTATRAGSVVTIADMPLDTVATCTFVNRKTMIEFKKVLNGNRMAAGDQFAVAIRTGGVAGTVVSDTTKATTLGTGATVTAGSGTTGSYPATAGTAYTLTEAAAGGANLASYNGKLTCVDNGSPPVAPALVLPTDQPFDPAIGWTVTPPVGASISCTLTNAPVAIGSSIMLQKAIAGLGRQAAADQFTVNIRSGGVAGTVVNSTVNSTTLGSVASVTAGSGTTGIFSGTPATAYTLNEAMAPGSTSTLARYTQALSCTNLGGSTDVSGFISLPLTFTLAAGDNVVCTVTNTPLGPAVSGRVFLDNGVASGIANDGLINGGEAGLAGIAVRLSNCAATVYVSGVTDGTGAYSLGVPTGTATGAALCVEQTNQGLRVSTGASVGSTALPSGTATPVTGTTYTYTRTGTPDRIAFSWNGIDHSGLNFGDVDTSTFAADGAKTGQPGTTVSYPHIFTAGTGGSVSFAMSAAASAPTLAGWREKIFADPACTGSLQPAAALLYPPAAAATPVVFGQQVCVILQQFIPATAQPGYSNDATVQANFSYSNASPALPTASYTLHDITRVGNGVLELKKEVRNVTQGVTTFGINNQAKSGDTLEYRISYTNNAPTPISNLSVNDTTPVYTSFVASNAGVTPDTLTACAKNTPVNPLPAPAVDCAVVLTEGGTGAVNWKFTGTLNPGGSGEVLFQVKVD